MLSCIVGLSGCVTAVHAVKILVKERWLWKVGTFSTRTDEVESAWVIGVISRYKVIC